MTPKNEYDIECLDSCMEHSGIKTEIRNMVKRIKKNEEDIDKIEAMSNRLLGGLALNLVGIVITLLTVLITKG